MTAIVNGRLTAAQLVTVGTDAHGRLARFRPPAASSWQRMRAAGMPHDVTDTYRDLARQERYWRNPPNAAGLAARPGTSIHGLGLAVDARGACLDWLARHGRAHGWVRTIMPAEPWHFEYREHLDRHKQEDDDMALTDDDIDRIAYRVWQYKNTRLTTEDAYSLLRRVPERTWAAQIGTGSNRRTVATALARIESAISSLPTRIWGFKRAADGKVRGADRVDVAQLLADVATKVTGKTPDTIKHPAQRKTPTDF